MRFEMNLFSGKCIEIINVSYWFENCKALSFEFGVKVSKLVTISIEFTCFLGCYCEDLRFACFCISLWSCNVRIVSFLKLISLSIFKQRSRCFWRNRRSFCVLLSKNCFSVINIWAEMHLWPSLKLRNSFKSTSQKRYQRMNSGKQSQSNQQKLLDGDKESGSPEISSGGGFAVVCRDVAMVLSCCYCCFCCGGK